MTFTILNTRPAPQNRQLTRLIEQQGWISIECPTIHIEPLPVSSWYGLIPPLESIRHMIFTSHHAVCYCLEKHSELVSLCQKPSLHIYAIGKATANTLASYGIRHSIVPLEHNSEGLLQCPQLQNIMQHNILLIKGLGGRELLENALTTRGARVHGLAVYQRRAPDDLGACIQQAYRNHHINIALYTSEESMDNLLDAGFAVELLPLNLQRWLLNQPALVISHRLANIAQKKGFVRILKAEPATIIETLLSFQQGMP